MDNNDDQLKRLRYLKHMMVDRGFSFMTIQTIRDEAKRLLSQEIPYSIDGDSLMMTVSGPMGEMKVVYNRHGKQPG